MSSSIQNYWIVPFYHNRCASPLNTNSEFSDSFTENNQRAQVQPANQNTEVIRNTDDPLFLRPHAIEQSDQNDNANARRLLASPELSAIFILKYSFHQMQRVDGPAIGSESSGDFSSTVSPVGQIFKKVLTDDNLSDSYRTPTDYPVAANDQTQIFVSSPANSFRDQEKLDLKQTPNTACKMRRVDSQAYQMTSEAEIPLTNNSKALL